jgi:hypothetical protein
MAFDYRSMTHLLSSKFDEYFNDEYPLFYKCKYFNSRDKIYYRNAIESALKLDLARSVDAILRYLVKY